jgi:hypothetical protein
MNNHWIVSYTVLMPWFNQKTHMDVKTGHCLTKKPIGI